MGQMATHTALALGAMEQKFLSRSELVDVGLADR